LKKFQKYHEFLIDEALKKEHLERDPKWLERIAVA
jgi:hypothetical protein